MLSSDHGGIGNGHGGYTPSERYVPFIVFGNNIKKGTQISQNILNYDIAPTIAYFFNLETPLFWEGRIISVLNNN